MNLSPDKIQFYRKNPTIACYELLNISLCPYQRLMLKALWFHRNCLWNCCRAAAKTFVATIGLTLLALLYPKVKVGVTSGSIPQACEIFMKIEEIALDAPLLANEIIGEITWNEKTGGTVKFKTGSWIKVFPLISRRRGKRLNVLFIDEYREVDEKLVNTVAKPMLNIKHPLIKNKVIYASTATYDTNPFYFKVREFEKMIQLGNKEYAMCTFDIDDARTSGYIDEEKVKDDFATFLPEEIDMEYYCRFVSLKEGFINGTLVRNAESDFKPKYKGESDRFYACGIDNARATGGDSFAVAVFEINPSSVNLVYAKAMNGIPFPQQSLFIRRLCLNFNMIKIRMDFDMAGKATRDLLINESIDPETGKQLPIVACIDDCDINKGLQIIENVNFAQKDTILSYGVTVKRAIQEKTLLFPKNEYQIAISEEEELLLPEYDREQLELYRGIQQAKCELTNIKQKPNEAGTSWQFVVDNPKVNKKDLGMAIFMGGSAAYEYWKGLQEESDDDFVGCTG